MVAYMHMMRNYKFCTNVLVLIGVAGLCSMGNTNAQDQELALQEEFHGQENSLMRKLSLLFHLATLMGLNGLKNNNNNISRFFFYLLTFVKAILEIILPPYSCLHTFMIFIVPFLSIYNVTLQTIDWRIVKASPCN